MRNGFLGSLVALCVGAGLAAAQNLASPYSGVTPRQGPPGPLVPPRPWTDNPAYQPPADAGVLQTGAATTLPAPPAGAVQGAMTGMMPQGAPGGMMTGMTGGTPAGMAAGSGLAIAPGAPAGAPAGAPFNPAAPPTVLGGGSCGPNGCATPCGPNGCTTGGCKSCCTPCGPDGRVWVRAEYLLWWLKNDHVPPLLTTGTFVNPATGAVEVGFLGNPGTTLLFGDQDLDKGAFSGGRFTVGAWLDDCRTKGVEAGFFFLGRQTFAADFDSGVFGSLARPFTIPGGGPGSQTISLPGGGTVTPGQQFSETIATPGISTGSFSFRSPTQLLGFNADVLCNWCCDYCCGTGQGYRVDLIGGFRYLDLQEAIDITERIQVAAMPTFNGLPVTLPDPRLAGATLIGMDSFHTRNQFYGGEVGLRGTSYRGPWSVEASGKVALGTTHQVVDINGFSSGSGPLGAFSATGNLLALPSNIGRYTHDKFSVVPEVGVNVGYNVNENLKLLAGYTFLYWSSVVRPGDQIDTVVDPRQLPFSGNPPGRNGAVRPAVLFRDTDFYAHGINLGAELRW